MATSIGVWVITLATLTGCGATGAVGLANAPALGRDTPETRVHDVIASGDDSCERSSFPPGEVLRGHIPPCRSYESLPQVTLLSPTTSTTVKIVTWHGFGVCIDPGSGRIPTEEEPAGLSVVPPTVVCER